MLRETGKQKLRNAVRDALNDVLREGIEDALDDMPEDALRDAVASALREVFRDAFSDAMEHVFSYVPEKKLESVLHELALETMQERRALKKPERDDDRFLTSHQVGLRHLAQKRSLENFEGFSSSTILPSPKRQLDVLSNDSRIPTELEDRKAVDKFLWGKETE